MRLCLKCSAQTVVDCQDHDIGPATLCWNCGAVGPRKPHLRLHYVAGHWAVDQPGAMRWTSLCPTAATAVELARRWFR